MRAESAAMVNGLSGLRLVTGGRIRHDLMVWELGRSKICFSPFGYGEVSWGDFEAVMMGAVLIKQDMEHVKTWPDIFVPMETYVRVKWGLSNVA